jgi:hypothetical protein
MAPNSILFKNVFLMQFLDRPQYAYNLCYAAKQAKALGYNSMSAIEFGVASGGGLLILEEYAIFLSKMLGIHIEVYGFDSGFGLPKLEGYKDIPQQWQPGDFPLDFEKLKTNLKQAKLILGDVRQTLDAFYADYEPAPVGAVFFDLDLYSSTRAALNIFNTHPDHLIPRVRCYFDDIYGDEISLTNEFIGEPLAINEYNQANESRKITPVHHLLAKNTRKKWYPKCFVHHCFDHPLYTQKLHYR